MYVCCYLRQGLVYIPTAGKVPGGPSWEMEPVQVVAVSDGAGLKRGLIEAIERGNPVIKAPEGGKWGPPVMPRYAGVKNWSAFARGALTWSLTLTDGTYRIRAGIRHPDCGWTDDPVPLAEFPEATAPAEIAARMAAILQEAAR